jgi:hypothetical protein
MLLEGRFGFDPDQGQPTPAKENSRLAAARSSHPLLPGCDASSEASIERNTFTFQAAERDVAAAELRYHAAEHAGAGC